MRVVIVGAGVSGLALAAMLRRINVQCLVIERKPSLEADFDIPVVLWSNALSCFRAFGIDQMLQLPGVVPEAYYGIRRAGQDSKWLLRVANADVALEAMDEHDVIPSSASPTATSYSLVSRVISENRKDDLAEVPRRITMSSQVLKHSLRAHVQDVRFGRTVVGLSPIEAGPGGVQVHLDNGHVEWGDVVIGADGLHSTIRHLVYPDLPQAHTSRSQNMTQIDGYAEVPGDWPEVLGDTPCEIWGKRKSFQYLPVGDLKHTKGGTNIIGFSATLFDNPQEIAALNDADEIDIEGYKFLAAREFAEFGPEVQRILSTASIARPTELLQVPLMRHWHHKRAVLLGDSAHGSFPSVLAQDTSLCVEDAALLATSLSRIPLLNDDGYRYALRTYEKCRRLRIQDYIRQSVHARNVASTKNTAVRDAALRLTPGPLVNLAQRWLFNWSYRGSVLHYDPYADTDTVYDGQEFRK
jgi:2-polyprenyl-6-methoxyphenol hydroxylase-like FAD-dependent oxidoreductase